MIVFKKINESFYQITCSTKPPLYISLVPNETISNQFDKVTSTVENISELIGKIFDEFFYKFLCRFQECDTKELRDELLINNVNKTLQFSTVFLSLKEKDIDYASFSDEKKTTTDSFFFDSNDIKKFLKLSISLKIYSVFLFTQKDLPDDNFEKLFSKFLILLHADNIQGKLYNYLKMIAIREKKYKSKDKSKKITTLMTIQIFM